MSTKQRGSTGLTKSLKPTRSRAGINSNYLLRNAISHVATQKHHPTLNVPKFSRNVRKDFENTEVPNEDHLKAMEPSQILQSINCSEMPNLESSETQFEDDLHVSSEEWAQIDVEAQSYNLEHLDGKIEQESKKLIFAKIIPITKSANKVVIVGVAPFQNSKVICRFTTASFDYMLDLEVVEFNSFISKLPYILENVKENVSNQLLCKFQKVHVYLISNCLVKVVDTFNKRYLIYTKETLEIFESLTNFIVNCINNVTERLAQNTPINIDAFLLEVSIEKLNRYNENIRQLALEMVKNKFNNSSLLYEIVLMYPTYVENTVNIKVKHMLDHNNYP